MTGSLGPAVRMACVALPDTASTYSGTISCGRAKGLLAWSGVRRIGSTVLVAGLPAEDSVLKSSSFA